MLTVHCESIFGGGKDSLMINSQSSEQNSHDILNSHDPATFILIGVADFNAVNRQ